MEWINEILREQDIDQRGLDLVTRLLPRQEGEQEKSPIEQAKSLIAPQTDEAREIVNKLEKIEAKIKAFASSISDRLAAKEALHAAALPQDGLEELQHDLESQAEKLRATLREMHADKSSNTPS